MRELIFEPLIPWALWLALALASAGPWLWYALASRDRLQGWRRPSVLALMAVAVLIPLLILLNPMWLERIPPPQGKPVLTILVDQSASMATDDVPSHEETPEPGSPGQASDGNPASRYEAACQSARHLVAAADDAFEVRVWGFSDQRHALPLEQLAEEQPSGEATDLAAALEEALKLERDQGQGVIVFSDGAHNGSRGVTGIHRVVQRAKVTATPLYSCTVGTATEVDDLALAVELPHDLAFADQRVPVVVHLSQRGQLAGTIRLTASRDGQVTEQREVSPTEFQGQDGSAQVVFELSESKPGLYRYEFQAEPLPGEVTAVNNSAAYSLRVIDQPVRVLLLEGRPYWDTKFLIRTLTHDRSVELTSLVRLTNERVLRRDVTQAENAGGDQSPSDGSLQSRDDRWTIETDPQDVLLRDDMLSEYQIVILGRGAEAFLGDQALGRLKKWLAEQQGSLVCFRGAPARQIGDRLAELLPVRWQPAGHAPARVSMTEEGAALRWLAAGQRTEAPLARMPAVAIADAPEVRDPLTVVLAGAEAASASLGGPGSGHNAGADNATPVIAYRPFGGGRVVVVEGAGMWRWAFLPSEDQQQDAVYGRLWRSMIRWLVTGVGLLPSQDVALRTDKTTFSTDEIVRATLLLRQERLAEGVPEVTLRRLGSDQTSTVQPTPRGDRPGHYEVVFGRLAEGRYAARLAGKVGGGEAGQRGDGEHHAEQKHDGEPAIPGGAKNPVKWGSAGWCFRKLSALGKCSPTV